MTFENKKIVSLGELRFTKEELKELDEEIYALIGTLSYAANEISVLQMLFVSSGSVEPKDEFVKVKWTIQRTVLLRLLNAKIFEAIKGIGDYEKCIVRANLQDTLSYLRQAFAELDELQSKEGFKVAKRIRDHATNHFLPSVAKNNLQFIPNQGDMRMFHHNMIGNNFHPLGEEVVFSSVLNQYAQETQNDVQNMINTWFEWSLDSMRVLTKILDHLLLCLVQEVFPQKYMQERKPYVEIPLAGDMTQQPLLLFHLTD